MAFYVFMFHDGYLILRFYPLPCSFTGQILWQENDYPTNCIFSKNQSSSLNPVFYFVAGISAFLKGK